MKKAKTAAKSARKHAAPRAPQATLASKRFEDQTKRMLGTHYTNKYGVRRGR